MVSPVASVPTSAPTGADRADRPSAPAQQDDELTTAGRWTGTTEGSVSRSNPWLEAGYRMHGDFWFAVSAEGEVDGYAVVVYEPYIDTSGVNAALGYVKDVGIGALGVLIPFPVDLAGTLGLDDLLAVRGQYDQPMSTMEGPITGTLRDGQLSLEWADAEQIDLPITVYMDGVDTSEEITNEVLATESPWDVAGEVSEQTGRPQAVSVSGESITEDGVTIANHNSWSAYGS
jgi:hypothetical protein